MPELPNDRIAVDLASLRDAAEMAFTPPPVERLRAAARRRTRRRVGLAALALAALGSVGGGALAVADRRPDHAPRPAPTPTVNTAGPSAPTSTPATTPPPATSSAPPSSPPDIRQVDWKRATFVLPPNPTCPTGRVTTRDERAIVGDKWLFVGETLSYGDLTGDGSPEAVVAVFCGRGPNDGGDGSGNLLVITWRDGAWTGLGYVGPVGENYPAARVSGQRLIATIQQRYGANTVQERTYRWDGRRFVQVDGPTTFPSS